MKYTINEMKDAKDKNLIDGKTIDMGFRRASKRAMSHQQCDNVYTTTSHSFHFIYIRNMFFMTWHVTDDSLSCTLKRSNSTDERKQDLLIFFFLI